MSCRERRIEEALRAVLELIDRSVLVRNTRGDSSPDWLKQATALVLTIKEAQDALEAK